jgi:hypothetical protein
MNDLSIPKGVTAEVTSGASSPVKTSPRTMREAYISAAIRKGRGKHPLIPKRFQEARPKVKSYSWFINYSRTADLDLVDPGGILLPVI